MIDKFKGCRKCYKTKGYLLVKTESDDFVAEKCDCLVKYQEESLLKLNLLEANIPDSFIDYNIDSYKGSDKDNNLETIQFYLSSFKEHFNNYHLYFYGLQGTQKTTLAKYMLKELIKEHNNCYYVLADDLIKMLVDMERNDDLKVKVDQLLHRDFLVIDEISDDKCTIYKSEYQIPFLTTFLKKRLEQVRKSTIFISNYSIESLYESKFGKTIADLINRECSDKLVFNDNYFDINKDDVKDIKSKLKEMMKE